MPDRSASAQCRIAFTSVVPANGQSVRRWPRRLARQGDREIPRMDHATAGTHGGTARTAWAKDLVCWCAPERTSNSRPINQRPIGVRTCRTDSDIARVFEHDQAGLHFAADPSQEPERTRRSWESHLARAKSMTRHGYKYLHRGDTPHRGLRDCDYRHCVPMPFRPSGPQIQKIPAGG